MTQRDCFLAVMHKIGVWDAEECLNGWLKEVLVTYPSFLETFDAEVENPVAEMLLIEAQFEEMSKNPFAAHEMTEEMKQFVVMKN